VDFYGFQTSEFNGENSRNQQNSGVLNKDVACPIRSWVFTPPPKNVLFEKFNLDQNKRTFDFT
jgi:hypothetical protein